MPDPQSSARPKQAHPGPHLPWKAARHMLGLPCTALRCLRGPGPGTCGHVRARHLPKEPPRGAAGRRDCNTGLSQRQCSPGCAPGPGPGKGACQTRATSSRGRKHRFSSLEREFSSSELHILRGRKELPNVENLSF